MKLVTIEYPEAGVCKLTLSASAEELEAAAQAVYERVREAYTIKGFAKGEANREQIEADRGEHAFWYEAINDVMDRDVPAILEEVVAAEKLSVEGEASFDLISVKKDEGFVACAELALTPELTVNRYTGFTARCVTPEVTDKEVEQYIEGRRRARSELVPHKGPAVKGNTVRISYEGRRNGKPFKGGKAENQELLLGSGRMVPGFEDGILGHKGGEEFDITVTFPVRYPAQELAGKEAVFHIVLHDVCLKQVPALDAELVKKLDPTCGTVDEYRAAVRKRLYDNKHGTAMNRAKGELQLQLANSTEGEVSRMLVERAYTSHMEQLQNLLQMQRMTIDSFLSHHKQTREQFEADMRARAEKSVRLNFALLKVAELEGLVPTAEELDAAIAVSAERVKKSVEEYAATVNRDELCRRMSAERAQSFVVEHSTIEEV